MADATAWTVLGVWGVVAMFAPGKRAASSLAPPLVFTIDAVELLGARRCRLIVPVAPTPAPVPLMGTFSLDPTSSPSSDRALFLLTPPDMAAASTSIGADWGLLCIRLCVLCVLLAVLVKVVVELGVVSLCSLFLTSVV